MRMRFLMWALVAAAVSGAGVVAWLALRPAPPRPPASVRVAAVQFHSVLGDADRNREGLAGWVREAAARGAKIVVLPEAAVSGYADLDRDVFWSSEAAPGPGFLPAASVAETIDGASVRFFSGLARDRAIYLTVPFVEQADGKFYNSVALLGPDGSVRIHYRKQHLWTVADPSWVTPGDRGTPVIDTEYGRIGVMVCFDVNYLLPEFREKSADIVLHCVAWYGPWFDIPFNRRVREAGVWLVLANWTFPGEKAWRGAGGSRIINRDGDVVARIGQDYGDGIVLADLPLASRAAARPGGTAR